MTLGGLALAVGILVDDATVEIENINRNLEEGKQSSRQFSMALRRLPYLPFVSTISILHRLCADVLFGEASPATLFVPLAEAVVFAMLASYLLSRTVVPPWRCICSRNTTRHEQERKQQSRNPWTRFQLAFEHQFERLRSSYSRLLEFSVDHALISTIVFFVFCLALDRRTLGLPGRRFLSVCG